MENLPDDKCFVTTNNYVDAHYEFIVNVRGNYS